MKILTPVKLSLLILLSLSITHCKTKFSSDSSSDVVTVTEPSKESDDSVIQPTEPIVTKFYTGDTTKIRFFDGGWYGLYPNYNMDLKLAVTRKGKIHGTLDTPKCKVTASVSVDQYKKLSDLLDSAKTLPVPATVYTVIDAGSKFIAFNKLDSANKKETHSKFHFQFNHPQLSDKSAEKIETLVKTIAAAMIKRKGCDEGFLKVKTLKLLERTYVQEEGFGTIDMQKNNANLVRKFTITQKGDDYIVNGTEVHTLVSRPGECTRTLKNKVLGKIVRTSDMEQIEFSNSARICLVNFAGNATLSIKITDSDGVVKAGAAGCWNRKQIANYHIFLNRFTKFLEKQPSVCTNTY